MPKLSKINNLLLIAIVLINSYLIVAPLYPKAYLWWQIHVNHQQQKLEKVIKSGKPSKTKPVEVARTGEWIIIPKIALDTQIYEGPNISTANKGVWHRPKSSSPDQGSNTVLVGHRFTYTQPKGIFYNLDKLTVGDPLALFWNGKEYSYKISDIKVVPPEDVDIESATNSDRLTIYTCTPLWSAKNRLVITAERSQL